MRIAYEIAAARARATRCRQRDQSALGDLALCVTLLADFSTANIMVVAEPAYRIFTMVYGQALLPLLSAFLL